MHDGIVKQCKWMRASPPTGSVCRISSMCRPGNSFSSNCKDTRTDFNDAAKYLHMIGSFVIAGIFRVGMISEWTISKRSF